MPVARSPTRNQQKYLILSWAILFSSSIIRKKCKIKITGIPQSLFLRHFFANFSSLRHVTVRTREQRAHSSTSVNKSGVRKNVRKQYFFL